MKYRTLTNTNCPWGSHCAVAVEVVNDELVHLSWMLLQQEVDLWFLFRLLFQFLFRSSRTNQHTHIRLKLRLSTRRDLVAVRCGYTRLDRTTCTWRVFEREVRRLVTRCCVRRSLRWGGADRRWKRWTTLRSPRCGTTNSEDKKNTTSLQD